VKYLLSNSEMQISQFFHPGCVLWTGKPLLGSETSTSLSFQ